MNGPAGFSFPTFAQTAQDLVARGERADTLGDAEFRELLQQPQKQSERIYKGYVADFVGELNKLSIALNTIQGRKHIIYFSEGFDSKVLTGKGLDGLSQDSEEFITTGGVPPADTESRFGDTGLRMKLYDALKMIANADTPIHTVDIGGLRTQASSLTQVDGVARNMTAIRRGQETLTVMSRETGGQVYRNINTLDEPLKNLLKVTNTYYLIGYYPEDTKKKGKFRKIKIKTDRRAVSISYRKGYYEEKPYKEYSNLEKRLQLVEYIVKDMPRNEIQFDSFVSAFRGKEGICQVPVFLKFPGRQFLGKRKNIKLEIYGYAISSSGIFKDFFYQALTVSPSKVTKKLELYGIKHFDLHLVPPGDYKIKLIVRDKKTGEIGSQIQEVSVPDYDKGNLALSGPIFIQPDSDWILSRGYDPKAPTGRKKGVNLPLDYPYVLNNKPFIPGVVPVFNKSIKAQFYLRVYNLRLHPQAQVPQTEISFEIMDMEGKSTLFRNVELLQTPTQSEPGVFDFLFQANFRNLAPGPYQLKLYFKDSLANQEVVSKTPFRLE
jgi:VWFA-related protein